MYEIEGTEGIARSHSNQMRMISRHSGSEGITRDEWYSTMWDTFGLDDDAEPMPLPLATLAPMLLDAASPARPDVLEPATPIAMPPEMPPAAAPTTPAERRYPARSRRPPLRYSK